MRPSLARKPRRVESGFQEVGNSNSGSESKVCYSVSNGIARAATGFGTQVARRPRLWRQVAASVPPDPKWAGNPNHGQCLGTCLEVATSDILNHSIQPTTGQRVRNEIVALFCCRNVIDQAGLYVRKFNTSARFATNPGSAPSIGPRPSKAIAAEGMECASKGIEDGPVASRRIHTGAH